MKGEKLLYHSAEKSSVDDHMIPTNFLLEQNYPNPFNHYTEVPSHVANIIFMGDKL
jgi:hypothetical protein